MKVDAPTGVLTDADRAALKELSPGSSSACLALTRSRRRRRSARAWRVWAGPGLIKIRDPFTGEWHEWQATECLTGVVAEADRLRKSS